MRGHLVALVSMGLVAAGCSGSGGTTTSGTSGGATTGGATSGGVTGSSTGTSTSGTSSGTTGGGNLSPGTVCEADADCLSGHCGVNGSGRCCAVACNTADPTCGATSCDSQNGACVYPSSGGMCGPSSCTGDILTNQICDGQGTCLGHSVSCPDNFSCQDAMVCRTSCMAIGDCSSGNYCDTNHTCQPQLATGPCTANDACASGVCGLNGTGNCCTMACSSSDLTCGASACDVDTGACNYPLGIPCGSGGGETCTGSTLTSSTCDATGSCSVSPAPCPNHLACDSNGTSCLSTCTALADCASGYYCNSGACLVQKATGICSTNDACSSGICGINGTGHFCCTTACSTTDPICGATDCDGKGDCAYATKFTSCGDAGSCTGTTQTAPTLCDGMGSCPPPAVSDCAPFTCGPTACLTTCTDNTGCASGDFCDTAETTCCSGLGNNGTLAVDGKTGNDKNACCGLGANGACLTLTRAMGLIANAQAQNVTINATVNAGGGDWAPATETYPINLGWGVELNAPGVYFVEGAAPAGTGAIFDVSVITGDTLHYASIVGSGTSQVGVGMNSTNTVLTAQTSAIAVENGQTLYIANATVNGSSANTSNLAALLVQAGGTLWVGTDQSGGITGTVNVGNALGQIATDGFAGIYCNTDGTSLGCIVNDAVLVGQSSVVIQGQEYADIDAEDFASITLTSSPVFGVPPTQLGHSNCPSKSDGLLFAQSGGYGGIFADGQATISVKNAILQCITGIAIFLAPSPYGNGDPVVTVDSTLVQNADYGIAATAGTATVTNSTVAYNWNGAYLVGGSIDLSGGGNTVICSSNVENTIMSTNDGIDVYNATTANLAADNVAWDTAGPDYFSCDSMFATCTCNLASCSATPPFDNMDAVEDSTAVGGITTTNNTLSGLFLDAGC